MRKHKHPHTYSISTHFPGAVAFRGWERGSASRGERDGKFFLIFDEGTMADFLDENDPGDAKALKELVTVIEFDTEAEREAHIAELRMPGIDLRDFD